MSKNNWQDQLNSIKEKVGGAQQPQQSQQAHQPRTSPGIKTPMDNQTVGFGVAFKSIFDSVSDGGEIFETLYEVAVQVIEKLNKLHPNFNLSVHRVMKQDWGNLYSAIAIANRVGDKVIFHTIMVEATGENPSPETHQLYGQTFVINRPPSVAMDKVFMNFVSRQIVQDLSPSGKIDTITVDGYLLPRETDISDRHTIENALRVSINAVQSETIVLSGGTLGLPISALTNNGRGKDGEQRSYFGLDIQFNNSNIVSYDEVGMPVRKDIVLKVFTKTSYNNHGSANSGRSDENIVNVAGYIDFKFNPGFRGDPFYGNPTGQRTYPFTPVFVVTDVDAGSSALMTPTLLMLGLGAIPALAQNKNWMRYFVERSNISAKDLNFADIGLLNIQGNITGKEGPGARFEVDRKGLSSYEIFTYISTLVSPNLMVEIDVPAAGVDTWFLSMLSHAYAGDDTAISRIIDGVNTLTGGGFATNQPIFLSESNLYHGGYFTEKGERYDLRCVESYLGFTSLVMATNTSTDKLNEYQYSLASTAIESPLRASNRLQMLKELGIKPVIKQMNNRLTFNSAFLEEASLAMLAAGYQLRPESTNIMNVDIGYNTYNQDWSQLGMSGNVKVSGFAGGTGNKLNPNYNPYFRTF